MPAVFQNMAGYNGVFTFGAYPDLTPTNTTLTEGTPPTGRALTIVTDSFTAAQKGETIEVSDLGQNENPHNLLAVAAERVARVASVTLDLAAKNATYGGVAANDRIYVSTATSRATTSVAMTMTGAVVKKVVATLRANNVAPFADGFYHAIAHPYVLYDLFTDTASGGWMDASKYVNNLPLLNGEIGTYHGVRFLDAGGNNAGSNGGQVYAGAGVSSANVYATAFFGPEFLTVTPPSALQAFYVAPGNDHNDPLAQKGIVGFKGFLGATLLVAAGLKYRIVESGATIG